MKTMFKLAVAAVFAFAYGNAYAFHSGGVAECNGCHTMHGSFENEQVESEALGGPIKVPHLSAGPFLLKGNDQSSACLNCHSGPTQSGYHVNSTGVTVKTNPATSAEVPVNYTPGGDFSWLKTTFTWMPRSGTSETSKGERHGHNVIAADFGFDADTTIAAAPGGTYPAGSLQCSSCHDPHGKYRRLADGSHVDGKAEPTLPIRNSGSYQDATRYLPPVTDVYAVGSYRLLPGVGYEPKSTPGYAFVNDPPIAIAPSSYNVVEDGTTKINRVAYGQGMSEYCANCHADIHRPSYTSGQPGLTHPAGNAYKLPGFIVSNYNAYKVTGDLSGTVTTSYNTLAPYEEGSIDTAALAAHAGNKTVGPTGGTENVSCMSCHRAHATAFDSILRFSLAYEFMTDGNATGTGQTYGDPLATPGQKTALAQGKTNEVAMAAYYGRPATAFAPFQRALCNKCHVKD